MAHKLFVNIPVKDLDQSIAFFTELGFSFNPLFTDETATCMLIGEDAFAMLLTEAKFAQFTKKPVADATASTEAILAISCDSRDEVDVMADKALAQGGKPSNDVDDMGFMYQRSFQDPDGHLWEVFYMDTAAMAEQFPQ